MTPSLLFAMPDNVAMTCNLAAQLRIGVGAMAMRKFPDRETYIRFETDVARKDIAFVCTLDDPDVRLVPLILAAEGARQLGAAQVGLIAPYLAYMRQDIRFQPGEAVTSRIMASLVSKHFDWLVTVDPHLHRYQSLSEIYSIPTQVVHAAPAIAAWIASNISNPFLIGPDAESAQWVSEIATDLKAPYATLRKRREGDRAVTLAPIETSQIGSRTPVLVDDIIASGKTMMEAVRMLRAAGHSSPFCVTIHGIFADGADRTLADMGAKVVATDTVPKEVTQIGLERLIADGILALRSQT